MKNELLKGEKVDGRICPPGQATWPEHWPVGSPLPPNSKMVPVDPASGRIILNIENHELGDKVPEGAFIYAGRDIVVDDGDADVAPYDELDDEEYFDNDIDDDEDVDIDDDEYDRLVAIINRAKKNGDV